MLIPRKSLILSRSGEQSTQSSTVSSLHQSAQSSTVSSLYESSTLPVNVPKEVNEPGVFSGACIGKIEGCSFTINIHGEKVREAQKKKSYHQR